MLFTSPLPALPGTPSPRLPADVAQRPGSPDWPFSELTQEQRLNKAKQEARMRAGALRGLPSCFGDLA